MELDTEFDKIKVPQLRKFPAIPGLTTPVKKAFVGQDHDVELLGQEVSEELCKMGKSCRSLCIARHRRCQTRKRQEDSGGNHRTGECTQTMDVEKGRSGILGAIRFDPAAGKNQRLHNHKTARQIEKYIVVVNKH